VTGIPKATAVRQTAVGSGRWLVYEVIQNIPYKSMGGGAA